jgi:Protein of unknown function (DUF3302)
MGFSLTGWDYITFAVIIVLIVSAAIFVIWVAGLPGRIAIARKHPDAEAVKLMGWAGLLTAIPWIQAFIWAYKPTEIVDIRRFPPEERDEIERNIARLRANGGKKRKRRRKSLREEADTDTGGAPEGNGHDEPASQ